MLRTLTVRVKISFVTQAKTTTPTFVFFVNEPALVHFTYERFLENALRESFPFSGSPVKLVFKKKEGHVKVRDAMWCSTKRGRVSDHILFFFCFGAVSAPAEELLKQLVAHPYPACSFLRRPNDWLALGQMLRRRKIQQQRKTASTSDATKRVTSTASNMSLE